jgi:hypothetical protein
MHCIGVSACNKLTKQADEMISDSPTACRNFGANMKRQITIIHPQWKRVKLKIPNESIQSEQDFRSPKKAFSGSKVIRSMKRRSSKDPNLE